MKQKAIKAVKSGVVLSIVLVILSGTVVSLTTEKTFFHDEFDEGIDHYNAGGEGQYWSVVSVNEDNRIQGDSVDEEVNIVLDDEHYPATDFTGETIISYESIPGSTGSGFLVETDFTGSLDGSVLHGHGRTALEGTTNLSSGFQDNQSSSYDGTQLNTIVITIDWDNDMITVEVNGNEEISTGLASTPDAGTDGTIGIGYRVRNNPAIQAQWDNVEIRTSDILSSQLDIDVDEYFNQGETKSYEVTLNETLVEGGVNTTDVTNDVNVTSHNTSRITVDESSNELTASTENVGSVNVTFEYESVEENVTIFVGPRTIGNIGSLPSSQWFAAAMGFDEENNFYVMGSEIQMVLLAVFIGAAAAWKARNEYLGIGTIVLAIIIFWTADHVSLGIVMVAVFYGLFAAYQNRKTPSRSDTKVGEGLQQTTDRFRR